MDGERLTSRIKAVLEVVGLDGTPERRLEHYSKGMTQRIAIGQALLAQPAVLILDEPMAAVDPIGAEEMMTMLRSLGRDGTTVLFSSHDPAQVAAISDFVAILNQGRLLFCGTTNEWLQVNSTKVFETGPLDTASVRELSQWMEAKGHSLGVGRMEGLNAYRMVLARDKGEADGR